MIATLELGDHDVRACRRPAVSRPISDPALDGRQFSTGTTDPCDLALVAKLRLALGPHSAARTEEAVPSAL